MGFIKRWIRNIINEQLAQPAEQHRPRLGDMFADAGAAVVAFKIENGYVVRTHNQQATMAGISNGGFTYCADHQAIADYIITAAAKDKLGVQGSLNLISKAQSAIKGTALGNISLNTPTY